MDEKSGKTRFAWFKSLTFRQKLVLAIVVSVALHFLVMGGAVLPEKIAEYRARKEAEAQKIEEQRREEQKKQNQIVEKKQVQEASRQTVKAKLKDDFDHVVANEVKQDKSDQLWDKVISKITKDLDTTAQVVADKSKTNSEADAQMKKLEGEMIAEMDQQLKTMTTKELAQSFQKRVDSDVVPAAADYYKQQVDKKVGSALKDAGSKIVNDDSTALRNQRRDASLALGKAEQMAGAAQSTLEAAQHQLDQQTKQLAAAKTDQQKQSIGNAIARQKTEIDKAVRNLDDAANLVKGAAQNDALPDHVRKSIASAGLHPAATQASALARSAAGATTQASGSGLARSAGGAATQPSSGGSPSAAAHSAGQAADAAGKFRDAIHAAKQVADSDARDNSDPTLRSREALKDARDSHIKHDLDEAFEKKVADRALPKLADDLARGFKERLAEAGIKDPAAVDEVRKNIADDLKKKVPGAVDAGDTATGQLSHAEKLDQVPANAGDKNTKVAGANGDGKDAKNGKMDGKADGMASRGGDGKDTGTGADKVALAGGKKDSGLADAVNAGHGDSGDAKDGKSDKKADDSHDGALSKKIDKMAKDAADMGMDGVGGDDSGLLAGLGKGKRRGGAGAEGNGDDDDDLVDLTNRVGQMAAGGKKHHGGADGGDGGTADADGDGAGAGGAGGAGGGGGGGGAGPGFGGSISSLRDDVFKRSRDAIANMRMGRVIDDEAGYQKLTADIHSRDASMLSASVRQDVTGPLGPDIAQLVAEADQQIHPAVVIAPAPAKDAEQGLKMEVGKEEPFHPDFKNIRFACIPFRTKPVKIDGDLSEWADVPALPMYPAGPGADDSSLHHAPQAVKVQWDSTGFYLAYDVTDADDKITKVGPDNFWQGDGIEFWIDKADSKEAKRTVVTQQFWAWVDGAANNPKQVGGEAISNKDRHEFVPMGQDMIQTASRRTATGWTIEVHIPIERLGDLKLEPEAGLLGMNFSICTGTDLYYYWAGTTEIATSQHPNTWGDVILTGTDGKIEIVDKLAGELGPNQTAKPASSLQIGQPLRIRVTDPDMSRNGRKATLKVTVASGHSDGKDVYLEETAPSSGVFEGAIRTALETGEDQPDTITLYEGENLSVIYNDQFRSDGAKDVQLKLTVPTRSAVGNLAQK